MSNNQDSLFSNLEREQIKEAIELLESKGYKVTKLKAGKKPLNMATVIEYFYTRLKEVSGDQVAVASRLSDKQDFKAVTVFQEKARKTGLSRDAANETLKDLIDMVFDYYKDTEKACPIYNLSYIISQRGSWVVQMSVQHARRKEKEWESSAEAEAIRRRIYSDLESEEFKQLQNSTHAKILQEELTNGEESKDN